MEFRKVTKVAIVAVLIAATSAWVMTAGKRHGSEASVHNATERDGRVQFKLSNTSFSIPKQYFKGVSESGGGHAESASLWALLPNFEGYDKAVNHHDFYEVRHSGRRIQIMLLPRGRRMTVAQYVAKDNARVNGVTVLGGRHQGGKYDEIRYGLEYYHSDFMPARASEYLHRVNGIPVLEFSCDDSPPPPPPVKVYPICKGYWDYNADIAVNFDFGINYLPEWQTIFTHIQQLLDGQLDVKPVPQTTIDEKQGG